MTESDYRKAFESIVANDMTVFRHGQKRRDGKKPGQAEKPGSIWLTPREIAGNMLALMELERLEARERKEP